MSEFDQRSNADDTAAEAFGADASQDSYAQAYAAYMAHEETDAREEPVGPSSDVDPSSPQSQADMPPQNDQHDPIIEQSDGAQASAGEPQEPMFVFQPTESEHPEQAPTIEHDAQQQIEQPFPSYESNQNLPYEQAQYNGAPVPPPSISPGDNRFEYPNNTFVRPEGEQNPNSGQFGMPPTPPQIMGGAPVFTDEQRQAKNFIMAAQITAIVSLFIGGVIAGIAAIAIAFVGYSKVNKLSDATPDAADYRSRLRRIAMVTIAMCAIALGLNIAMIVALYPQIAEYMQTGDPSALMSNLGLGGESQSGGNGSSGGSVWG